MKLIWFQVQEFQSVKNSGIIQVDNITCLVGKNESGKTALLRALYRLHPIIDTDGIFNVTNDYPRMEVEDYQFDVKEQKRTPAVPIQAGYQLEQAEITTIQEVFGKDCMTSPLLSICKNYDNKVECSLTIDTSKALAYFINHANFPEQIQDTIQSAHLPIDPLIAALEENEQNERQEEIMHYTPESLLAVLDPHETRLASISRYDGTYSDSQVTLKEVQRVKKILTQIQVQGLPTYILTDLLKDRWPTFLYFDEYYQMTGRENIQALIQREAKNELRPSDHPMLGLVRLARLQLSELLNPNSTIELRNKLEGASNYLTKQALKYWSQNKHLKMNFDVRQGTPGDPLEMRSGMNIWGGVFDTRHQVTTELSGRSRGFLWFFSFLAWYSEVKRLNKQVILLLDEPGLTLHATAQCDLLHYFETELMPHHQLIYSTHSPFMLDPDYLERVRVVEDRSTDAEDDGNLENSGTIVLSNLFEASAGSLFPLQGVLSYGLHQNQNFAEVFDAFYIHPNERGKIPLAHDLLDGARSIRPFLANLLGEDADTVDYSLADLLAQAKAGQHVEKQIADLLASHESTQAWMSKYLARKKAGMRFGGYEPPLGSPAPIAVLFYTCPENDYIWPRRTAGQQIPHCPTHNISLIPLEE